MDSYVPVTLLDVGGIMAVPVEALRQIRMDYLTLPFQAAVCSLHGILPMGDNGGRFLQAAAKHS